MATVLKAVGPDGAHPHSLENIEAEAALIGACMISNEVIPTIAKRVSPEDFHEAVHGRIFAAILERHSQGKAVAPVFLKPMIDTDEDLQKLGGQKYLAGLTGDASGLLAPDSLADEIRDFAKRRRLRDGLRDALNACGDLSTPTADIAALATETIDSEPDRSSGAFDFLSLPQVENLPSPTWLVHNFITEHGLTFIYGPPGTGKSFVALDMALRLALGMDWHGVKTRKTGVLYIAGEGSGGFGQRVKGWKQHHGIDDFSGVPFALVPVAVQLLDGSDRERLRRTIEAIKAGLDFDVGLVVVDTVSRAIAGVDENTQETMSAFVRACDDIKAQIGGALIGIHHSGKDTDRGMRGSSVLLGASDTVLKLEKSDNFVTITTERQKDGEEAMPVFMTLEKREFTAGTPSNPGEEISTLIPIRTNRAPDSTEGINREMIGQAFGLLVDAWTEGKPLSSKPQTRRDGRYAPRIFNSRIGGEAQAWETLLMAWLDSGSVAYELYDKKAKMSGLRVVDPVM